MSMAPAPGVEPYPDRLATPVGDRWRLTTLDRFAASVSRIARAAREAGVRVLLLPITDVTMTAEMRTPFTNREIARYNRALQAAAVDGVAWIDAAALFPNQTPDAYCHAP